MSFNKNLLQARKEKGMSQEELAKQLNVTRQTVSKWETGESLPDLFKLSALADALDVSIDSLCDRQPPIITAEAPPAVGHRALPLWKKVLAVLAVVALLVGSFFAGAYSSRQTAQTEESVVRQPLPDQITVSGAHFSGKAGTTGILCYQFMPGVTGESYTYRVTFLGNANGLRVYDVICRNGICKGEAALVQGESYTVSLTVSNGDESRTVCIASGLMLDAGGSAGWHKE